MSFISAATSAIERIALPDAITRAGIAFMVDRTRRKLERDTGSAEADFAAWMKSRPIATHTDEANEQHYELPPEFFAPILGAQRKYSCCLFTPGDTLDQAEERALSLTAEHAGLSDGQDILELGCGWGSLSLWMAANYPRARITAVSNSHGQRFHIEAEAARRGLTNLRVITQDMNRFAPDGDFDRIVSVEMWEHMSNWPDLLSRVRAWLRSDGRLFLHVFSHTSVPYYFDQADRSDWIAQHFFTGGIMPSHGLLRALDGPFEIEREWRWNGEHYQRTAEAWLTRFDASQDVIMPILRNVYGENAELWKRRWRLFFLATAGLFGAGGGEVWGVSHYRMKPR